MKQDKVLFGIGGLDELLGGGIPKGHHVVICGGPGSGKTLLCCEFLYRGAKIGENGVYISVEEPKDKMVENIRRTFTGWTDFDHMLSTKKLIFEKLYPGSSQSSFEKFANKIQDLVSSNNAKRIAIDSSTILKSLFKEDREYRLYLFALLEFLNRMDATVLITLEMERGDREKQNYHLEQFVSDGVIMLHHIPRESERVRAIEILKMRGASHSEKMVPLKITSNGILVFPTEKIY